MFHSHLPFTSCSLSDETTCQPNTELLKSVPCFSFKRNALAAGETPQQHERVLCPRLVLHSLSTAPRRVGTWPFLCGPKTKIPSAKVTQPTSVQICLLVHSYSCPSLDTHQLVYLQRPPRLLLSSFPTNSPGCFHCLRMQSNQPSVGNSAFLNYSTSGLPHLKVAFLSTCKFLWTMKFLSLQCPTINLTMSHFLKTQLFHSKTLSSWNLPQTLFQNVLHTVTMLYDVAYFYLTPC